MWERELAAAKQVAVEAGKEIMKIYSSAEDMQVEYKDGDMPLTAADKAANRVIISRLRKEFPDYAILSEEEKDNPLRLERDLCFVVDPLDGTKEFIKRNGQFTVNIALSHKHRTVMGVIYVPVSGELYYASQGQGAFRTNVEHGEKTERLHVSANKDIKTLRVVLSNSHGCKQMDELLAKYQLTNFVQVGSSLKGCMIASGEADVYYRYNPTMEWDTAAMQCIVEEAGGVFRQMDGTEMLYNRENSLNERGFYAINCMENRLVL